MEPEALGLDCIMDERVQLSIALVTRNRPESLHRTLMSLRAQSDQPLEVVVSDDSSGHVAREVERLAEDFRCRYIQGPQRGLYANRNHAALACRGSHIRTMDDDHELPPGHVERCYEALHADARAVWIIGEWRADEARRDIPPRCPGQLNASGFSEAPQEDSDRMWAIADGSSIFPRSVFDAGHRYVEAYPFGASYLEWGARLAWLGFRIRFLSSTYVVHHFDPSRRSFSDRKMEISSRLFAAFCYSFIYQPSVSNVGKTLSHCSLAVWRHKTTGIGALTDAVQSFSHHVRGVVRQRK